jgi:hypothetical protein
MDLPLDQRIDAAHAEAERAENEARQVEARIVAAGGIPPKRQYGRPVDPEAVRKNLTLVSVLNRRDPALASYLGVGSDYHRRQQQEREAAALRAQAMQLQTEQLRAANAEAQRQREWAQLNGRSALTGRRLGQ